MFFIHSEVMVCLSGTKLGVNIVNDGKHDWSISLYQGG